MKTLRHETPVFARPLGILILSLASFFVALPSFADELITLATRPGVPSRSYYGSPIHKLQILLSCCFQAVPGMWVWE